MNKVGIVLLNYNSSNNCIKLAELYGKMEIVNSIVIVDNNSTDNSIKAFETSHFSKKVKLIRNEFNAGYAKGNNIGLRYLVDISGCSICIVSNPDVIIDEDDLVKVISYFDCTDYALLTCRRKYSDGSHMRQYWNLPTIKSILLESSAIYRKWNLKHEFFQVNNDSDEVIEIEAAPGAFFAIRSDVLKSIDYLDEDTFLYYEENFLGYKLQLYGYKLGYVTSAIYISDNEKSSTNVIKKSGKAFEYQCESKKRYVEKYLCNNSVIAIVLKCAIDYSLLEIRLLSFVKKVIRLNSNEKLSKFK